MEIQKEVTRTSAPASTVSLALNLQTAAEQSQALRDVGTVFATRERSRQQVTVHSLYAKMTKEGFKYSRTQLGAVLKTLAGLGVGTLITNKKGNPIALKNIKVTLQSVGAAIAAGTKTIAPQKQPVRFVKLPPIDFVVEKAVTPPPPASKPDKAPSRKYTAALMVTVDQETIEFTLPRKLTMQEVSELLTRIYESKEG